MRGCPGGGVVPNGGQLVAHDAIRNEIVRCYRPIDESLAEFDARWGAHDACALAASP